MTRVAASRESRSSSYVTRRMASFMVRGIFCSDGANPIGIGLAHLRCSHVDADTIVCRHRVQCTFAPQTRVLVSSSPMRRITFLLLAALFAFSCGGAKATQTPDESADSEIKTPETRCIALARGARERQ